MLRWSLFLTHNHQKRLDIEYHLDYYVKRFIIRNSQLRRNYSPVKLLESHTFDGECLKFSTQGKWTTVLYISCYAIQDGEETQCKVLLQIRENSNRVLRNCENSIDVSVLRSRTFEWCSRFCDDRKSAEHDKRSGR